MFSGVTFNAVQNLLLPLSPLQAPDCELPEGRIAAVFLFTTLQPIADIQYMS